MSPDKQQLIFDSCPLLFCDYASSQYAIKYGIETYDGWFEPILDLCEKLEVLIAALPAKKQPVVHQIKTKFGELRFYISSETEEMKEEIRKCEDICRNTCEFCGSQPASQHDINSWYSTFCQDCYDKKMNELNMRKALK